VLTNVQATGIKKAIPGLLNAEIIGAATLSIITFSITILSIMGQATTLCINDTQLAPDRVAYFKDQFPK
jgi:hypothetical protein